MVLVRIVLGDLPIEVGEEAHQITSSLGELMATVVNQVVSRERLDPTQEMKRGIFHNALFVGVYIIGQGNVLTKTVLALDIILIPLISKLMMILKRITVSHFFKVISIIPII